MHHRQKTENFTQWRSFVVEVIFPIFLLWKPLFLVRLRSLVFIIFPTTCKHTGNPNPFNVKCFFLLLFSGVEASLEICFWWASLKAVTGFWFNFLLALDGRFSLFRNKIISKPLWVNCFTQDITISTHINLISIFIDFSRFLVLLVRLRDQVLFRKIFEKHNDKRLQMCVDLMVRFDRI